MLIEMEKEKIDHNSDPVTIISSIMLINTAAENSSLEGKDNRVLYNEHEMQFKLVEPKMRKSCGLVHFIYNYYYSLILHLVKHILSTPTTQYHTPDHANKQPYSFQHDLVPNYSFIDTSFVDNRHIKPFETRKNEDKDGKQVNIATKCRSKVIQSVKFKLHTNLLAKTTLKIFIVLLLSISTLNAQTILIDIEAGSIKLTGGEGNLADPVTGIIYQGNVQIYLNNTWGFICDDEWDMEEAQVICRQLGFPSAVRHTRNSEYGIVTSKYWLDNLNCNGNEESLMECRAPSCNGKQIKNCQKRWGKNNCLISEAAGVICKMPEIHPEENRISNDDASEQYSNTINSNSDTHDQIESISETTTNSQTTAAINRRRNRQRQIANSEDETRQNSRHRQIIRFDDQSYIRPPPDNQQTGSDVTSITIDNTDPNHESGDAPLPSAFATEGENSESRTENSPYIIFRRNNNITRGIQFRQFIGNVSGGNVSSSHQSSLLNRALVSNAPQNTNNINVIRPNLSPGARITDPSATIAYLEESSRRRFNNSRNMYVSVAPNNAAQGDFAGYFGGGGNSGYYRDRQDMASISVRLEGGAGHSGRVAIKFPQSDWGYICGDGWSLKEATVICKMLNFGFAEQAVQGTHFGTAYGPVLLSQVSCQGAEHHLGQCRYAKTPDCPGQSSFAGVYCGQNLPDLVVDYRELEQTIHLQRTPLLALTCAMEENCISASAYDIVRENRFDWANHVRYLLRFTTAIANIGTAPFNPFLPKNMWDWHECHQHYHSFEIFSVYRILDKFGNSVANGQKASFCLEDAQCRYDTFPTYQCRDFGDQGISVGCIDVYKYDIDCQWVDMTDVAPGDYTLVVSVNPDAKVPELDHTNNQVKCDITFDPPYQITTTGCRIEM